MNLIDLSAIANDIFYFVIAPVVLVAAALILLFLGISPFVLLYRFIFRDVKHD